MSPFLDKKQQPILHTSSLPSFFDSWEPNFLKRKVLFGQATNLEHKKIVYARNISRVLHIETNKQNKKISPVCELMEESKPSAKKKIK